MESEKGCKIVKMENTFNIEIYNDEFILKHTPEQLCSKFTKRQLSDLYTKRLRAKPRSNMSKEDIASELILSIKYLIRNRALSNML